MSGGWAIFGCLVAPRGRRDPGTEKKERATLETETQMQYNPKPKAKEGSARVVEMNGHQRLMSFEENLIEVGVGPANQDWTVRRCGDGRTNTGVSAAQPVVVCEEDDVNCGGGDNRQVKAVLRAAGEPSFRRRRVGMPERALCCVWTVKSARLLRNSRWLSGEIRFEAAPATWKVWGEGEDGEGGEVKRREQTRARWQCAAGCPAVAV